MLIHCHKSDLLAASQTVSRAISGKNTLPVLSGILINASNGAVSMRATDLDIAVQCGMPADVAEEGEQVIADGRRFLEIVRQLPDGEITLRTINDCDISLKYDQANINVRGFEAEQFPMLPGQDEGTSGIIATEEFCRMVRQTAFAASTDESRTVFTGVMLDIKEEDLVMVATDTHRLSMSCGKWQKKSGEEKKSVIIPAKTLSEVVRVAQGTENILINISASHVSFVMEEKVFISRIISGQYPDYKQVFPAKESLSSVAFINRTRLLETFSRASLLAAGNNSIVKLKWEKNKLTVMAEAPEVGNIKEETAVILNGGDVTCAYNVRYIMDVLRAAGSENISWHFSGPLSPAVLEEEKVDEEEDNKNFVALVLPVRLS